MPSKWWYAQDKKIFGPIDDKILYILMFNGSIGPKNWMWRPGLPAWTRLEEIEELKSQRRGVSPSITEQPEPDGPLPDAMAPLPARPIARAAAQIIDVNLIGLIVGFGLGVGAVLAGAPDSIAWLDTPWGRLLFAFIIAPISLFTQAFLLRMPGTTPGKALLGLRVVHLDGRRPTLRTLMRRQWRLWGAGWAYGIPFLNLLTFAANRTLVRDGKPTAWDEENGLVVYERHAGWVRPTIAVVLYFLIQFNGIWLALFDKASGGDSAGKTTAPAITASASWQNPVTGINVTFASPWIAQVQTFQDGKTGYLFLSRDHAAEGLAQRGFFSGPFSSFVTQVLNGIAPEGDGSILEPAPGRPSCVRVSWLPEQDGKPTGGAMALRLCGTVAGEFWDLKGHWTNGNEQEQQKIEDLLNRLQDTVR